MLSKPYQIQQGRLRRITRASLQNFLVLLACALASSWLALSLGRDVPWDYYNYHAYAAYSLTHDRLQQDFFPAGLMGYLNPIGFIPLALAQHWKLGSMATAMALASLHSLNAFFLYLTCRDFSQGMPRSSQAAIAVGWFLGVSTPVLLTHLGSTFVDPLGAALVMAAAWMVLFRPQPRWVLLAGALSGIAVAVKLSNVVFAVAIAIAIALPYRESLRSWLERTSSGALGMLGAFVVAQGYWSWRIQETMGSPFFPFFNSVFRSPYFTTESLGALRFRPLSPEELLTLPFRMARSESWVYIELVAPTLVPALCFVAAIVFLSRRLILRHTVALEPVPGSGAGIRLGVLVLISVILWIATSTNGRYGIPLFLLMGPASALLVIKLLPPRYALLLLVLAAVLQTFGLSSLGVDRWGSNKWTPQLVSVDMPASLRNRPQLFISLVSPSHSELVPLLHPNSVYVNLRGAYTIPSMGPAYERLQSLIEQHAGRTQALFALPYLEGVTANIPALIQYNSALLDRVGLRLLPQDCQRIRIDQQSQLETRFNKALNDSKPIVLMSCRAVTTVPDPVTAEIRRQAVKIMDGFEAKCPRLFFPSKPQIEGVGAGWVRRYYNYDTIGLYIRFDRDVIVYGLSGQTSSTYIGKASDWQATIAAFNCELPGRGKRGISFFNEYESDAIWF